VRSIALIPDNIIRSVYVRECIITLDIEESVLYTEINKINRSKQGGNTWQRKQAVSELYRTEREALAEQHNVTVQPGKQLQKDNELEKAALHILRYLIRYGDYVLYEEENKETKEVRQLTVADYILAELENDGLVFENLLHRQLLDDAKSFSGKEWNAENYFKNHVDIAISSIAVDLITEPYQLSKIHEKVHQLEPEQERLIHLVPRVVLEYKNKVVLTKIKHVQVAIKEAQETNNVEMLERLLVEYTQLNVVKNMLAKELGERIILK
jgi:DNA primase